MSTFERTEAGFAAALASAQHMAKLHGKPFALFVPRTEPTKYATSVPVIVRAEDVEPGTRANLIDADGNITPMFDGKSE